MDLAKKKGHNTGAWFACGFFFGIFGLIAAAGLPLKQVAKEAAKREPEATKRCPDCAGLVKQDAHICRYCGHRFSAEEESATHVAALESDDPQVRRQAIEALSHEEGRETWAHLIEGLSDPDASVRLAAIESLQRIGDSNAAPHILDVLEHARQDFSSPEKYFPLEAAAGEALQVLGTEAIVPRLVALSETKGIYVPIRAVKVLGAIGGPEAIRALVKLLNNDDEFVAGQAATALECLGEPAIPYLEQAVEEDTRTVRKAAKKLLKSIRNQQHE